MKPFGSQPNVLFFVLFFALPNIVFSQQREEQVEYFRRLELDSLVIDSLNLHRDRKGSGPETIEGIEEVVGEYVQQFLNGGPTQSDFAYIWDPAEMQRRTEFLPGLKTPAWKFAVLAARFRLTDKEFEPWQNRRPFIEKPTGISRELQLILRAIENEFESMDVAEKTGRDVAENSGQLRFRGTALAVY